MDRERDARAPLHPAGRTARTIGVTKATLHRMRRAGEIEAIRLPSGHFRFDLTGYLRKARGMEQAA